MIRNSHQILARSKAPLAVPPLMRQARIQNLSKKRKSRDSEDFSATVSQKRNKEQSPPKSEQTLPHLGTIQPDPSRQSESAMLAPANLRSFYSPSSSRAYPGPPSSSPSSPHYDDMASMHPLYTGPQTPAYSMNMAVPSPYHANLPSSLDEYQSPYSNITPRKEHQSPTPMTSNAEASTPQAEHPSTRDTYTQSSTQPPSFTG